MLSGIDVLEKNNFDILRGKKVGVIINHTSVNKDGINDVDIMLNNGIDVRAIFSPEHGFLGNVKAGESVGDGIYRGIPVYSLYGSRKRPDDKMLKDVDILVFDIQDVGARFYTYLTTMGYAMEEANRKGIKFVVLDRPNPVSGVVIEGPILEKDIKAFTAYFSVPIRHSLTAAEMAIFHKMRLQLNVDLKIVKMEGYRRDMFFDETGMKWINPSPNIRNLYAAVLYSGIGCFESTNISVGRGTESPFEFFGAPWLDNLRLVDYLNTEKIKGVRFEACDKIPLDDLYSNEVVKGVCIKIVDIKKVRAFNIFVHSIYFINLLHPDKLVMKENEIALMTGSKDFYSMIKNGKKPKYILERFSKDVKEFKRYIKAKNILLY